MTKSLTTISLALDWTPNTNHIGFYVARAKGFYADEGLELRVVSPHVDGYQATPCSRLTERTVDLAISPKESVVSFHTWPQAAKPKIVAIATMVQKVTHAVVTLKSSGIDRPAKLAGKRYASYAARYEGRMVQELIKADGGSGEYIEDTPEMLGIWNTVLAGKADATWVFLSWEGVEAARAGVELNVFKFEDYGIPLGYSPVLIAHPETLEQRPEQVARFLAATAKGFQFAAAHPDEAAAILVDLVAADTAALPLPTPLDPEMVRDSARLIAADLLDSTGAWGRMDEAVWSKFLDWISDAGLLTTKVQSRKHGSEQTTSLDGLRSGDAGERVPRSSIRASDLFSNRFLP
ncbi:hypothetical protein HK105_202462 [Polyrhizophydium stewartii]|uniref:4-amino-5-hydroxymethyl-2-methylpyrimidine phosphate synthase n=1 Tax=Polyrhizophydium stewartii TaxID=2732419 RepID=A0ABR4NEU5_9FUNG|nr:hypothetical protein HK105_002416 [Polyrhizophydium stewartii]